MATARNAESLMVMILAAIRIGSRLYPARSVKGAGDFPTSAAISDRTPQGKVQRAFRSISYPNMHPMAWTITDHTPSRRIFTRPLSPYELGFFYDGKLNGATDLVENYLVVTSDETLFRPENVSRAWVAVKQIFPLLGATAKELEPETLGALFTVSEFDLKIARPGDITFGLARSEEEVYSFVDQLISGPRQLSDELLARLFIYSRTDKPGHFHIFFHRGHLIIDGTSALTMIRTFFDILSHPPCGAIPEPQTRLALCVGSHNLNPNKHLPEAQIRWRRAAGHIILQNRFKRLRVRLWLEAPVSLLTHDLRRGVQHFRG